jgi:hypothetical protein
MFLINIAKISGEMAIVCYLIIITYVNARGNNPVVGKI